jgi:hemin uptake protein HemP
MNTGQTTSGSTGAAGKADTRAVPRVIESAALFQGQPILLIRHLGEVYRLQTTRQGKLILTK